MTKLIKFFPLLLIRFYQKFISPHKGFRCASNALHEDGSCSGVVFNIINTKPIGQWRSLIKGQFGRCKSASITINEEREKEEKKRKDKDKKECTQDAVAEVLCCAGENSGSCLGRGLGRKVDCTPDCGDCGDIGSCV